MRGVGIGSEFGERFGGEGLLGRSVKRGWLWKGVGRHGGGAFLVDGWETGLGSGKGGRWTGIYGFWGGLGVGL